MMKLHHLAGACSLADLIVLQWVGVPHQAVRVTLESLKTPEYLRSNAAGMVPLLEHGDFSLTENVAILGYLADLYPEARLLGDGTARSRAEVMRWLGFLNSDVHGAFKPLFTPARFLSDPAYAPALADAARARVLGFLERLDRQLEEREWIAGERSIADPYLFVICRWSVGKAGGLDAFANLARFLERMYADAGVQAALANDAPSATR